MSVPKSSPLIALSLALNVCTLGGILYVAKHQTANDEATLPEQLSDMADDISSAKIEMKNDLETLKSLIARLNTTGPGGPQAYNYDPAADIEKMSSDDLLKRWLHVCEVLSRNRHDPLQREPVEKERGRVEEQMRARGEATVASIAAKFKEIEDNWLQTRLLTNVIEPMKTEAGFAFAKTVFEDTTLVGGLRLYAAQVLLKKDKEGTMGRLIDLLEHPDPTFDRRDQIVTFLKSNPDSRAAPILVQIAKADDSDRNVSSICSNIRIRPSIGAIRS